MENTHFLFLKEKNGKSAELVHRDIQSPGDTMRFNSLLNFVSNIRRKVLFATSRANLSRHFFNGNQFLLIPLGVSNGFRNGFTMTDRTFTHNYSPPNPIINPFIWIGFICRYNTYYWEKCNLDMQRPTLFSFTIHQATWTIFISRVIFYYFSIKYCLVNFLRTNVSVNSLFKTMFGITKLFFSKSPTYFFNLHKISITYYLAEIKGNRQS